MYPSTRKFQSDIDRTKARRQRESHTLSLRRKDRELTLQKKRSKFLNTNTNKTTTMNAPPPSPNDNFDLNDQRHKEFFKSFVNFNRYVQGCFSHHEATQFECTQKIRKLLSTNNAKLCNIAIKAVIDNGIIPRIIQFLNFNDKPQLQMEALWLVTNVATSSINEYVAVIIKNGAIPIFIQIIKNNNCLYSVKEMAIWAIANIVGDCVELRDMILSFNILPILFPICKSRYDEHYTHKWKGQDRPQSGQEQYIALMESLPWCLSNLCRYQQKDEKYTKELAHCLWELMNYNDNILKNAQIDHDISWSFHYLVQHQKLEIENNLVTFMNDNGITQRLINKLKIYIDNIDDDNFDFRGIDPWVKTIGNMLVGNDQYVQKCIDFGILSIYYKLITLILPEIDKTKYENQCLKEICWSLSNICAGTLQQNNAVLICNLFPFLIDILDNERYETAKEALWALSNATEHGNKEIILYLVEKDLIKAICSFLTRFIQDQYQKNLNNIIQILLNALENIFIFDDKYIFADKFEEYGGLDALEDLQSEDSMPSSLYENIVGFMGHYFELEEVDVSDNNNNHDDNINNNNNNSNNDNNKQFGFGIVGNNNNDDKQFEF